MTICRRHIRRYDSIRKYTGIVKLVRKGAMRIKKQDVMYGILATLIIAGITNNIVMILRDPVTSAFNRVSTERVFASDTVPLPTPKIVYVEKKDDRAEKLEAYLQEKNSPFADHASYIVSESDKAGIDYTLIVAISGKESTFGKYSRCYNAWGLGGRNFMCFSSWEESISYMARLLGTHYRKNIISGIQPKYCPTFECATDWTAFVTSSSEEILGK